MLSWPFNFPSCVTDSFHLSRLTFWHAPFHFDTPTVLTSKRTIFEVFLPDFSTYLSSIMEALGGYPTKSSASRAGLFKVLLSVAVCMASLYLLQSKLTKSRKAKDFYSYEVKDARGRAVSLEKYRGKVSCVFFFCFKWFDLICKTFEKHNCHSFVLQYFDSRARCLW